jgi:hypothetical protein
MKKPCTILVGKPYGKISFGRYKRRWEYNIKLDLGVNK